MIRVVNKNGAPVCGIAPGAEGDVDEKNRGVAGLLAARVLVRAGEVEQAAEDRASVESLTATNREMAERIAQLEADLAEARAQLDALTAPQPPAEGETDTKTKRAQRNG